MAFTIASSSSMSPSEFNESKEDPFYKDQYPSRHMSLPLQPPVRSASQILGSSTRTSISSQLASARYIQQCRTLMDRQRQAFDEERALWNIERTELHEKIVHLESAARRFQGRPSSQLSSPTNRNGSPSSVTWRVPGVNESTTSSGDEFWRGAGGKSDAQPIRTFSETSSQSVRPGERLASIAEDAIPHKSDRSFSAGQNSEAAGSQLGLSGNNPDHSLDGITFKSANTAPAVLKDLNAMQSPSPRRSPSRLSPGSIPLPSYQLGLSHDPYTKDAGHTPLARRSGIMSGVASSDPPTPAQPETERPPLEPHTSAAKIPSERSRSYFPEVPDINEDPEMKKPLSLHNNEAEDSSFLDALDSKLEVAKSENLEPTVVHDLGEDNTAGVQPEPEPKLRIKRSMNFGSQLGTSACGKGF